MRQFGSLYCKDDPKIVEFLNSFTGTIANREASINELREIIRSSEISNNRLLIYARMFFWGYITYDQAFEDLQNRLSPKNFVSFDAFERTEITTCLGPRLSSKLAAVKYEDVDLYKGYFANSAHMPEDFIEDEIWIYQPPPTGFFSVVENIVLAKFICLLHKKVFSLDENFQQWWRYPVSFNELFDGRYRTESQSTTKNARYLPWSVARDIAAQYDVDLLRQLSNFKKLEYRKIRDSLKSWLETQGEKVAVSSESALYFIRGGDKLVFETMPTPEQVVEHDFNYLFQKTDQFLLLSDDYQMANSLVAKFGVGRVENITEKSRSGYFINNASNQDDVRTIVRNYLILASVKYSLSCPSSNLVNSAHWSNESLVELDLKSTPLLRYVFL